MGFVPYKQPAGYWMFNGGQPTQPLAQSVQVPPEMFCFPPQTAPFPLVSTKTSPTTYTFILYSAGTSEPTTKSASCSPIKHNVSEVEPTKKKWLKKLPKPTKTKQDPIETTAQPAKPSTMEPPPQPKTKFHLHRPAKTVTRKVLPLADAADLFTSAVYFMGKFLSHGQEVHLAAVPIKEINTTDHRWPNPRKSGKLAT